MTDPTDDIDHPETNQEPMGIPVFSRIGNVFAVRRPGGPAVPGKALRVSIGSDDALGAAGNIHDRKLVSAGIKIGDIKSNAMTRHVQTHWAGKLLVYLRDGTARDWHDGEAAITGILQWESDELDGSTVVSKREAAEIAAIWPDAVRRLAPMALLRP